MDQDEAAVTGVHENDIRKQENIMDNQVESDIISFSGKLLDLCWIIKVLIVQSDNDLKGNNTKKMLSI